MAAPFLADVAACWWLFLEDMGATAAKVLQCPAAMAAAHLRMTDCCKGGDYPRVGCSNSGGWQQR